MKQTWIHSVLGTPYVFEFGDRESLELSPENIGECRVYAKKILVCTEKEDCVTEEELDLKVREILAHEIFHAYLNEAGIDLDDSVEEQLASFYMKNWRKMSDSILEVADETGFLDK